MEGCFKINKRIAYAIASAIIFLVEVLIALFVQDDFIRPYVGDMLVVVLIYTFLRTFFPKKPRLLPLYVFLFAALVEGMQAMKLVELLGLQNNRFFSILIGTTFDWKDIACYGVGCLLVAVWEVMLWNREKVLKRLTSRQSYLESKAPVNNFARNSTMGKIAVSACLLGENCKYSGGNNQNEAVLNFIKDKEVIPVCPEVAGGLPTPRVPVELVNGVAINKEGRNVDKEFYLGVEQMLAKLEDEKIDLVILQPRSPSCGTKQIYDGTFTGTLTVGQGMFARALMEKGYKVVEPDELENL